MRTLPLDLQGRGCHPHATSGRNSSPDPCAQAQKYAEPAKRQKLTGRSALMSPPSAHHFFIILSTNRSFVCHIVRPPFISTQIQNSRSARSHRSYSHIIPPLPVRERAAGPLALPAGQKTTRTPRVGPGLTRAEFNLARRERPAAEPAAVGIQHHGVDLPGCLHCVVRLFTPITDVSRNIPDDDNPIPNPCDELCLSFLQGSFTKCTSFWNHFFLPVCTTSI